ncbi:MAG: GntR family transcriptional regulator [Beijerinckiaceae bacterium]
MAPEVIATQLRTEMMTGILHPGTELSQVVLAERFGVSRIPIRDALRVLAGEGLVELIANRGAKAINLSAREVREIFDLRILLECDCLRRAVPAITPVALQEIDRVRRKSDLDATGPDWAEGDWAFHRSIYRFAERNQQLQIIEALRRKCLVFISAYATLPTQKPKWLDDHRTIYNHISRGETEDAVEVLERHLAAAADHLLKHMARLTL